ncbi:MAG: type II secretion system protein N [Burkholderiales bacterium]|nr:type II secretion system protein N [Burkholderiales bacterium]
MMKRFVARNRKIFIILCFSLIFIITLIYNIPSWILGSIVDGESNGRLKLYNTEGTFWDGSGLLVAFGPKLETSAPLILLNWSIKLGFSKLIDIQFSVGTHPIADVYINKNGLNLDHLNISLSITQVEQLFDIVKDMGISGNINVLADHVQIGKQMIGEFKIHLDNISSGISPVNPLGSYSVELSADSGKVTVMSNPNAVLNVDGSGSIKALTLNARVNPEHQQEMLQFITLMGVPKTDGSYQLKIF